MFGRLDQSNPHDQGPLGRGVALYATVADDEDIDGYFQRVKDAGATVVQEPTDQFWGHRDWGITDPDGYLLIISKVTAEVSAEAMREAALAGSPAARTPPFSPCRDRPHPKPLSYLVGEGLSGVRSAMSSCRRAVWPTCRLAGSRKAPAPVEPRSDSEILDTYSDINQMQFEHPEVGA